MSYDRVQRIAEEIKKMINQLLFEKKIKDSRISESKSLISITNVDLVRDYKIATIYISVLGPDKKSILEGFKSAAGYIRRSVGQELKIRYTPELQFKLDESIEKGVEMSHLIDELAKEQESSTKE